MDGPITAQYGNLWWLGNIVEEVVVAVVVVESVVLFELSLAIVTLDGGDSAAFSTLA